MVNVLLLVVLGAGFVWFLGETLAALRDEEEL